jgi:hypothetical protein
VTDIHPNPVSGSSSRPASTPATHVGPPTTRWTGWVVFAGVMMLMIGTFQAIQGLVALFRHSYYLVPSKNLLVTVNYTGWGWTHLLLGIVVALAGVAVIQGSMWGRVVGVVLAGVSALVNLAFLSAFPLWSLIIISMDTVVMYALIVHGAETKE